MNRERLRRIRNCQSDDWYPALVVRPLTILVMLVIADWRFLTPNVLTTIANVAKIAAVALLLPDERTLTLWAVVILQLGVLFDHLDGTMARYRGASSTFGSFYDKVSDAVLWFPTVVAIGWIGYQRTGDAVPVVLAASSAYALLMTGYMKWLNEAETRKATGPSPAAPAPAAPPERSGRDWALWFGKSMLQVYRFEEMDLYFWVGLLLVLDELEILLWGMAVTQTLRLVVMLGRRAAEARTLDRKRRQA